MKDYQKFKIKGSNNTLKILVDENPESPRNWDNLGVCAFFHSRYDFGDKVKFSSNDFDSWTEMKEAIVKDFDGAIVLSVYMLDHSGITIATTPFSCPWDSGQLGFIYVTKERLRAEYSVKRISKKVIAKAAKVLQSEIKILDQYLMGDVYGFVIEDETESHVDSCYGFFGSNIEENGILENAGFTKEQLEELAA